MIIYVGFALIWLIGAILTYRWIMSPFVRNGRARGYLDWKFVREDDGIWLTAMVWPGFWLDQHRLLWDILFGSKQPTRYLSWYQAPLRDQREYLCKNPDEDGFYYSREISLAHRFDTFEEALKVTPIYDGSSGIKERAGVIPDKQ